MKTYLRKLVFVFIFLFYLSYQLDIKVFAQESLMIDDYQSSYTDMKNSLGYTNRILNFTGVTYLAEFDSNTGIYPGHLGSFWALIGQNEVYSTHLATGVDRSAYWRNAFGHGLLFYNRDTGACESEKLESFDQGTWYPSKLIVTSSYTTPFNGKVTGTKMGIPGYQGFALKIKIENTSNTALNLNLLSYSMLNSIDNGNHGSKLSFPKTDDDANNKRGTFQVLDPNPYKVLSFSSPALLPNAFLSIGFDSVHPFSSFRTENQGPPSLVSTDFCDGGNLSNLNNDTTVIDGSEAGITAELPIILPGQSQEVTILFVFGSTAENAALNLNNLRKENLELRTDTFWNQRLALLWSRVPRLSINNPALEAMYRNSLLNIPMNYFDNGAGKTFYGLGDIQYVANFPWMINAYRTMSFADPDGLKSLLKTMLKVDLTKCKAYNPLTDLSYCSSFYAFDPNSMVLGIYDYLTISGDWNFLNETVSGLATGVSKTQTILGWLRDLVYLRESSQASSLVDFGNDNALYEFRDPACSLRGLYTGKVPTPNGERYIIHRKLAEIYRKVGDESNALVEDTMALNAKNSLGELWNNNALWFDSISLYDENRQVRGTPYRNTFYGSWIFHLLDYPGLLTPTQESGILSHLDEFMAPYGLYSLSTTLKPQWCTRADWQGPGIYVGELGRILEILFQKGHSVEAYSVLQKLNYFSKTPYFAQCTDGDNPRFSLGVPDGCGASAYLENAVIAQTFISGMFGVRPEPSEITISPVIPSNLLLSGPVSLSNLLIGDDNLEIEVNSGATTPEVIVTADHHAKIIMPNNTTFILKPEMLTLPGDLNQDGRVDLLDLRFFLSNFLKPWNIFDYNKVVENFGK